MATIAEPAELLWAQLEPGAFDREHWSADLGAVRVDRHTVNIGFKAETGTVEGRGIIGVVTDEETDARWFGTPLGQGDVALARGRLDLVTHGRATFCSATIDTRRLERDYPGSRHLSELIGSGPEVRIDRDSAHAMALSRSIHDVLSITDSTHVIKERVRHVLLPTIALCFEDATDEQTRSSSRRVAAVRACEAYLDEHFDANPTLLELSAVAGLRMRSLINAFRAITGTSPMAYLKTQRLNAVHRALEKADKASTRIIDVAANAGFWHMGHFTADYRAMFGETPSETLRKS